MNIESINTTAVALPRVNEPVQQIDQQRQQARSAPQQDSSKQNQVQSEELLDEIKSMTDNGRYSVRFEKNDELEELIVKIVNQKTNEVVRQIPPEELINLSKHLRELQGNIVDTVS